MAIQQHKENEISNSYADEIEDDEKELEHSSIQEKLDMELKELDKKLEQKEVKLIIFLFIYNIYFLVW